MRFIFKPFVVFVIAISNASIAVSAPPTLPKFGDTPDRPMTKEFEDWKESPETTYFSLTKCAGLFLYLTDRTDSLYADISESSAISAEQREDLLTTLAGQRDQLERIYTNFQVAASSVGSKQKKVENEMGYDTVSSAFGYERYNKAFDRGDGPIIATDSEFCAALLRGE